MCRQAKFSELTIDMFRMLQTLEREPQEEGLHNSCETSPNSARTPYVSSVPSFPSSFSCITAWLIPCASVTSGRPFPSARHFSDSSMYCCRTVVSAPLSVSPFPVAVNLGRHFCVVPGLFQRAGYWGRPT